MIKLCFCSKLLYTHLNNLLALADKNASDKQNESPSDRINSNIKQDITV